MNLKCPAHYIKPLLTARVPKRQTVKPLFTYFFFINLRLRLINLSIYGGLNGLRSAKKKRREEFTGIEEGFN